MEGITRTEKVTAKKFTICMDNSHVQFPTITPYINPNFLLMHRSSLFVSFDVVSTFYHYFLNN